MENSSKERTLQWIAAQCKKGNISFSHKLQRPIGLWNNKMKSLLIHSLLTGVPVNPIYVVVEDDVIYPLDGAQRTSTCIEYVSKGFALNKTTPVAKIKLKENGQVIKKEFDIAGKKFDKLDPEVQETLLAACLNFCTLTDYTDDEIKEMFKRQNTSKNLSNPHSRVVLETENFRSAIYDLAKHPVMVKLLTDAQIKKGLDRDLIIQTLMLASTDNEHDFTGFRTKEIDKFIVENGDESLDKAATLNYALNALNDAFEKITIPQSSIPMVLYSCYKCVKDNKPFDKLVEIISEFLNNYDNNEAYKQYTQSGTSNQPMVRGRFDYWRNLLKEM